MDALPSLIGRYQIRQQLGQGGMGVLYLAFDPTMDRLVALKLLRVNDAQWRERFLREARLVARLQHPNIITVYDVGSHDGQPFMAMEYIDGNTLDTIVRRRVPLSRERKLEIMLALCDGLAYAHRFGVIHRDVKPSNLIVHRESGILKVLDFGIARTHDSSLTLVGSIMGTPNYMSPEQVQGQTVDHRSDVFAVGVVLYELLAHRQAFTGETPFLVLQEIVHSTPEPLTQIDPTIDPKLAAIVDRAMAKDPHDRYPDLDVMRHDLIDVLRTTEQEQPYGREKTMVILARAAGVAGASSGGSRERFDHRHDHHIALVTPPPGVGADVDRPRTSGTPEAPSNATNVIAESRLTPPPTTPTTPPPTTPLPLASTTPLSLSEGPPLPPVQIPPAAASMPASETSEPPDVPSEPEAGRAGFYGLFDSQLSRIAVLAVAAALLFFIVPIALLTSRSGSAPSASSTPGAASKTAAAAPASKPLASAALPGQTALLAPALASDAGVAGLAEPERPEPPAASPRSPAATGPGAVRGSTPPSVYEKPADHDDLKDMQETLDRWKRAYESRDVGDLTRVWPTISSTQARSLDSAFGKMTQMTVLFRQCSLRGTVAHASATCRVERSIRFKSGRTEKVPSRVAFALEKRDDKWVIVSVRGA